MLRGLLAPFQGKVSLALVYGSVAQGKEHAGSDVDLLVIGTVLFADVVEACHAGAAQVGRDVNPVVMTEDAFYAKLAQGDRFLSRVAKEPKIVLVGDPGEFGKSAEDRST